MAPRVCGGTVIRARGSVSGPAALPADHAPRHPDRVSPPDHPPDHRPRSPAAPRRSPAARPRAPRPITRHAPARVRPAVAPCRVRPAVCAPAARALPDHRLRPARSPVVLFHSITDDSTVDRSLRVSLCANPSSAVIAAPIAPGFRVSGRDARMGRASDSTVGDLPTLAATRGPRPAPATRRADPARDPARGPRPRPGARTPPATLDPRPGRGPAATGRRTPTALGSGGGAPRRGRPTGRGRSPGR